MGGVKNLTKWVTSFMDDSLASKKSRSEEYLSSIHSSHQGKVLQTTFIFEFGRKTQNFFRELIYILNLTFLRNALEMYSK